MTLTSRTRHQSYLHALQVSLSQGERLLAGGTYKLERGCVRLRKNQASGQAVTLRHVPAGEVFSLNYDGISFAEPLGSAQVTRLVDQLQIDGRLLQISQTSALERADQEKMMMFLPVLEHVLQGIKYLQQLCPDGERRLVMDARTLAGSLNRSLDEVREALDELGRRGLICRRKNGVIIFSP